MAMNIMIQGTMSNAGKSLLAAGLCRVLKQDGYRVAPFKSQNMALNSFITRDGGEMGRAQVVQAEAAGIEPDTRMNPILLKPTTDVGSQVIINGQVRGNMQAMEYFRRKRDYIPAVLEAYNSLNSEYDVIVIEGAGSPAEINLKQDDIVNMGLAKLVDAPVLLVGDIDRGGVFAQLYGTVALLEEDERRRIKGVVVNKFRGDRAILEPGLKTLEELCGIPVAGVIPYTHVDIDDEDSLTERFGRSTERKLLDIAVIRVPRISNFTDFSPFEHYENVSLRYVDQVSDLHRPDMILLPGTKSTIADQVEAAGVTEISGMGLLDMDTEFRGEKVQTQTRGVFHGVEGMLSGLNGLAYEGYEIHMGRSRQEMPALSGGGNVYGSYVHGIFDAPGIADTILRTLCAKKGVSFDALATFDTRGYKERQYDLLADVVRGGLDMSFVYRVLRREV